MGRILAVLWIAAAGLGAARREIKPGWNLFSREQDVELGKEASREIEKQVTVVRDHPDLQNYIAELGSRLARVSQAPEYPYTFKVVGEKGINAFALPGGPIYVHAATIVAADNEGQLAGVVAHEISHIALRHSTNQVTKAYAVQIPLALAGLALGNSRSLLAQLTQLGIGFGASSILLKYSRNAERDADLVGARMLAAAGYDPIDMARFFEKLEKQGGGGQMLQFLSDHPNPGNRVKYVEEEVRSLPRRDYSGGSANFPQMKSLAARLPVVERKPPQEAAGGRGGLEPPSSEQIEFRGRGFRLAHPANWKAHGSDSGMSVTMAPPQGAVQGRDGQVHIAVGAIAGYFPAESRNITRATDELVSDLRAKNQGTRPLPGQRRRVSVDGSSGETLVLAGVSPVAGEQELDILLTAMRPEGLFYLVLITPENHYNELRPWFQRMQGSVRFR